MNPLFAQLALDWLDAERQADPERWPNAVPKRDDMTVAIDRVYLVITGNVLWSEASPGDKAVWKSRVEDIPTFARSWHRNGKPKKGGDRTVPGADDPYNQTTPRPRRRAGQRYQVWWNYFDTLQVTAGLTERSVRMFDNKNVGYYFLSNLQVAGQIAQGGSFEVHRLYVAISSLEALHWAADRVLFNFAIGSRPAVPIMFTRDLFRGIDLGAQPVSIPPRQDFWARAEFRDLPPPHLLPFDLVFHIEGYESRD